MTMAQQYQQGQVVYQNVPRSQQQQQMQMQQMYSGTSAASSSSRAMPRNAASSSEKVPVSQYRTLAAQTSGNSWRQQQQQQQPSGISAQQQQRHDSNQMNSFPTSLLAAGADHSAMLSQSAYEQMQWNNTGGATGIPQGNPYQGGMQQMTFANQPSSATATATAQGAAPTESSLFGCRQQVNNAPSMGNNNNDNFNPDPAVGGLHLLVHNSSVNHYHPGAANPQAQGLNSKSDQRMMSPPQVPPVALPDAESEVDAPYPIQVGETLPPAQIDLHGVYVNLKEFFEDRTGVLFGLLGAYHPTDTKVVVPAILSRTEDFQRLVDFVGCLVVNDPFVVKAWARKLNVADQCTFIADSDAKFTQALGMETYLPEEGFGLRCRRFAMIVGSKARVRWIAFDEEASANNVIRHLPFHVRTPWKSFLVGISYADQKNDTSGPSPVVESIETVRAILAQQGYCSESDWQLILSNEIEGGYEPTRGNIVSGLKWLVEGAQSGDSLFFYFCGRAAQLREFLGDESDCTGLIPIDHDKAGLIEEGTIYEIVAPNVCEGCRVSLIFDCTGNSGSACTMPYVTMRSPDKPKEVIQAHNSAWHAMQGANNNNGQGGELRKPPAGEIFVMSSVTDAPERETPEQIGFVVKGMMATRPESREVHARTTSSEEAAGGVAPQEVIVQERSYADKLLAMEDHMRSQRSWRRITFESSTPFALDEEFSFSDILFSAETPSIVI